MPNELELPKVPELYTVTTGYDDLIENRANEFFNSILDYLQYNERAREVFVKIEGFHIVRHLDTTMFTGSDEYIRLLDVRDLRIASVMSTRDDFNYCQVASAHYLTPALIERLREGIV
jgi:hypothetical protein